MAVFNLAPYSFFNTVSSEPPLVMISTGLRSDGRPKDTRENVKQRQDFLIHIASVAQLEDLNASSATLSAGESEVAHLGLTTFPLAGSRLPRLKDARVVFVRTLHEKSLNIGGNTTSMILGRVRGFIWMMRWLAAILKAEDRSMQIEFTQSDD